MHEHLCFLKTSSAVVKIAAWIFLFFGLIGGLAILFGAVPENPPWKGAIVLVVYTFFFFFLFLIAKIADLLVRIISTITGGAPGGNENKS